MTILDRNSGVVSAASTTWNITRSTGSFGTGTTLVVALFGNTVFNTPSGWTQRANSVADMGLYSFDKTGAGEASLAFTCTAAGTGEWYVWELSAGSIYVVAQASQVASPTLASYACPDLTPSAGFRHMMAVGGGNGALTKSVTAWSNSFVGGGTLTGGHAAGGDLSFSGGADRDLTADGTTAYGTTATFSAATAVRGGITMAYSGTAPDTTPPSIPTGLAVSAITSTGATLTWNPSTDDVGVTGYEVQIIGP